MMKKIVVALGGNAILSDDASARSQQEALRKTAERLVALIEQGYELVISHGNGPQVGNLFLQQMVADSKENPALPLDTCVAMTQGSIGYWLQKAMRDALRSKGIKKSVATLLTQTVVSEDDLAFKNPTKPIGPFLTKEEKDKEGDIGTFIEDSGRGYRRVVPSPKPISISEADLIRTMVDAGVVTIASGGGGIPVIERNGITEGIEAVVDKDLASEKLAELVDADKFIILTAVDHVYIDYNKPEQEKLINVTVDELKGYIKENQFAEGSMLPKVKAAIQYAEYMKEEGEVIITSLDNVGKIFTEQVGTHITK